jgi:hypothetical protein
VTCSYIWLHCQAQARRRPLVSPSRSSLAVRPYRPRQATRSRALSENGSISTTIFLIAALGAFRRPTTFILMNPTASSFASVRVRLGCARPVGWHPRAENVIAAKSGSEAANCGPRTRGNGKRSQAAGIFLSPPKSPTWAAGPQRPRRHPLAGGAAHIPKWGTRIAAAGVVWDGNRSVSSRKPRRHVKFPALRSR